MRKPAYLIPAIVVGIIFLLSIIAFRNYLPYAGGAIAPKEPPKVVLAMHDTYFVGLGKKGKVWSIKAKTVEIGQDRSLTTIKGITDGRIYDSGKPTLKLKAKRAVYDSRVERLALAGGIAIEGIKGERVTADNALWNSTSSTLRSNGRVCFENKWGKTLAQNLAVDLSKKELTMTNISGTIDVGGAEKQR